MFVNSARNSSDCLIIFSSKVQRVIRLSNEIWSVRSNKVAKELDNKSTNNPYDVHYWYFSNVKTSWQTPAKVMFCRECLNSSLSRPTPASCSGSLTPLWLGRGTSTWAQAPVAMATAFHQAGWGKKEKHLSMGQVKLRCNPPTQDSCRPACTWTDSHGWSFKKTTASCKAKLWAVTTGFSSGYLVATVFLTLLCMEGCSTPLLPWCLAVICFHQPMYAYIIANGHSFTPSTVAFPPHFS